MKSKVKTSCLITRKTLFWSTIIGQYLGKMRFIASQFASVAMKRILPAIVLSQFFCTSLWFAGNAVATDMIRQFAAAQGWVAHLTSAVQAGFITGTLVFAILGIADRFSPSKVFAVCALLAAAINLSITMNGIDMQLVLMLRFATGVFLAGIYPVGMKIAADYYQHGLGKSLGYLVGALVMGTALPHLLKGVAITWPWKYVFYATSLLATAGGATIWLLVPDGPYRKPAQQVKFTSFLQGFNNSDFRAAAFGYFGHMWELYAFWMFVPVMLLHYMQHHAAIEFNTSLLSFFIIASGSIACVLGGLIAQRKGAKRTAVAALSVSCICCLVSPLILSGGSVVALILFLLIWGMAVVADSPLFSTLVANSAPIASKGASLTIVNSIGFAITIVSIQVISAVMTEANATYIYPLLAIGPVLGLIALLRNKQA